MAGPGASAALPCPGRPVPRRVAALLAPPPRLPLLLLAAAIVLVAVSGASALEAARNLHQLIELAQGQPALTAGRRPRAAANPPSGGTYQRS